MFLKQHKSRLLDAKPLAAHALLPFTLVLADDSKKKDVERIIQFCKTHELNIVSIDHDLCHAKLCGSVENINQAFQTEIKSYVHDDKVEYHGYLGDLTLPNDMKIFVVAVIGLSNHTIARPYLKKGSEQKDQKERVSYSGYNPTTVANAYQFPAATGVGESIALIELGGGYRTTDLPTYFRTMGVSLPNVVNVSVDGATNSPTVPDSADGEVNLDIQIAGAVAPGANILVYFAPNSDNGFYQAIIAVTNDKTFKPKILSISWGGPENDWDWNGFAALNSALVLARRNNITVFVASGDGGSSDGEGGAVGVVDFPSSSAHVTACGGTSLVVQNNTIVSEVVWNNGGGSSATGGGISDLLPVPAYQSGITFPAPLNQGKHVGRGVPDVAGCADPDRGFAVLVDATWYTYGGTSCVAPLFAGLAARLNQLLGKRIGFFNPTLYTLPSTCFHDITVGNNGVYSAGSGWDACSGRGSPQGTAILQALRGGSSPTNSTCPDDFNLRINKV